MWHVYLRRIVLSVFAIFTSLLLVTGMVVLNTVPVEADSGREELKFPFAIEGTDLVAEYFISYEGDYFEDQSGEFIMDGVALCVSNQGDAHIEFASVHIETLDGIYCFEGTCIPPKSTVVILEKYKSIYPTSPIYLAIGTTKKAQKKCLLGDLQIVPIDIGRFEVTNCSDYKLEDVTLYYKRYDSWWDIYIGGITYAISAGTLQAGESKIVFPANYANGYSKVLYATAN